jgi:hypothetical protein
MKNVKFWKKKMEFYIGLCSVYTGGTINRDSDYKRGHTKGTCLQHSVSEICQVWRPVIALAPGVHCLNDTPSVLYSFRIMFCFSFY